VAGIAAVIGVIIALFFFLRTTATPAIGDHIHGALEIYIWGQRQPDLGGDKPGIPTWESGIHTHGDGLIHIHPQVSSEEGAGAALGKWFESGGMKLTKTTLRLLDGQEYNNGDVGPDGQAGVLRVLKKRLDWRSSFGAHEAFKTQCSELADKDMEELGNFPHYVPKDGDCVRIVFGPEGSPSAYGTLAATVTPTPIAVGEATATPEEGT